MIGLFHTAHLAAIVIAFACQTALSIPILTVVILPTTAPSGRVFAAVIVRASCLATFVTTVIAFTDMAGPKFQLFAAPGARCVNQATLIGTSALKAAKGMCSFDLARMADYRFSAMVTSRRFAQRLGSIEACLRTIGDFVLVELAWFAKYDDAAAGAWYFNLCALRRLLACETAKVTGMLPVSSALNRFATLVTNNCDFGRHRNTSCYA